MECDIKAAQLQTAGAPDGIKFSVILIDAVANFN
jgi:hypothetical protein